VWPLAPDTGIVAVPDVLQPLAALSLAALGVAAVVTHHNWALVPSSPQAADPLLSSQPERVPPKSAWPALVTRPSLKISRSKTTAELSGKNDGHTLVHGSELPKAALHAADGSVYNRRKPEKVFVLTLNDIMPNERLSPTFVPTVPP